MGPHPLPAYALAALGLAAPGCVLPVGPRFEDPEQNFPPYIVDSNPPVGSIVTALPLVEGAAMFSVTLADPNLGDRLWLRWIFDFPPWGGNTRRGLFREAPPPTDGSEVRTRDGFQANCSWSPAPGVTQHRLMLAVSDREFLSENADDTFLAVPPDARTVRASWILNLECKPR